MSDIIIERLASYFDEIYFQWNPGEIVFQKNIKKAIAQNMPDVSDPYGHQYTTGSIKEKPISWHLARVLYFIRHPEEIKNILIDNYCENGEILPIPEIRDGNHRFLAAIWLQSRGMLKTVKCQYSGREDLLNYLTGKTNEAPVY